MIDSRTTGHTIAYLTRLARDAGFDVDLDAISPVTAHHPDLVVSWVPGLLPLGHQRPGRSYIYADDWTRTRHALR